MKRADEYKKIIIIIMNKKTALFRKWLPSIFVGTLEKEKSIQTRTTLNSAAAALFISPLNRSQGCFTCRTTTENEEETLYCDTRVQKYLSIEAFASLHVMSDPNTELFV